jgi:hypothetical protein
VIAFGREVSRVQYDGVTRPATAVETIICKLDLDAGR